MDNVRIFSEFFAKSPSRGGGGAGLQNSRLWQNQTMCTFDKLSSSTCSTLCYNPLLCFYIIMLKLKWKPCTRKQYNCATETPSGRTVNQISVYGRASSDASPLLTALAGKKGWGYCRYLLLLSFNISIDGTVTSASTPDKKSYIVSWVLRLSESLASEGDWLIGTVLFQDLLK